MAIARLNCCARDYNRAPFIPEALSRAGTCSQLCAAQDELCRWRGLSVVQGNPGSAILSHLAGLDAPHREDEPRASVIAQAL
jgi:hypothetical protein